MVVMVNELIAMSRQFMGGIPVDQRTLALDAIERVAKGGPGSMFLADDHTFDNFRQALFMPRLLDRSRYDHWEHMGKPDLSRRCNQEAQRLLAEHQVKPKPADILKEIEKVTQSSR